MFTGRSATPPPEICSIADYGNSFNPDSVSATATSHGGGSTCFGRRCAATSVWVFESRAGVLPCAVREIEREAARERYEALGNLAGLAVTYGLYDASIERDLPEIVRSLNVRAINDPQRRFAKDVARSGSGSVS
jgi:hypothetical protein